MSILIKGMEMPKNCMSCPFPSVGVDWYYCYCPGVDGKAYDFEQSNTVPDDCPLVALPDHHGRLVDADALEKAVAGMVPYVIDDASSSTYTDGVGAAYYLIGDAPTIVEAEGE